METTEGPDLNVTRRRMLGLAAGSVALAGCMNGSSGDDPSGEGGLSVPVLGDPDADVTVAVYEDYACGHCANYNVNGFPKLKSDYIDEGTIRYEHRDFPIPVLDPGSWVAANAAREVQDRNGSEAFYEYAKSIFKNYRELQPDAGALVERLADDQGLDGAAIREAGVDQVHDDTVRGDRQKGINDGIEATPSFVVNGEIIATGFASSTLDDVSQAIEERL
jgi:protein-disulfide isomerase